MSYTKFGEFFRILRIRNHEVLADATKFLNVSSAFISAVECGKKQIPEEWFEKISRHYNLNEQEKNDLRYSIDQTIKTVKIDLSSTSDSQRNTLLQFQRSFKDLDDDTMNEIQKILERWVNK